MSDPPSDKKPKRRRAPRKRKSVAPPGGEGTPRSSRLVRWGLALGGLALAGALGAAIFGYPLIHGPGAGRDVEILLPGGESSDALAERLATAGLIAHPRFFAVYLRFTGGAARAVKGVHLLTDDLSPREVVARLERSAFAGHARVTFPEGWTRFDIGRRLQQMHVCTQRGFLDASADPDLLSELRLEGDSAEGFLFPATYDLAYDADPKDVVRRMKTEFDKRWSIAESRHGSSINDLGATLGWRMRQFVTLASMVEKEAVADDERGLIASVFVNRLRDPAFTPKLLQCDPTAGYGCLVAPAQIPSCATYTGKITHDIVADPSNPYNTYKHEGLPPGPISNPGMKSLEAAMAPSITRWLYFVARGDGHSTFSETYGAHNSAVHGGRAPSSTTPSVPASP